MQKVSAERNKTFHDVTLGVGIPLSIGNLVVAAGCFIIAGAVWGFSSSENNGKCTYKIINTAHNENDDIDMVFLFVCSDTGIDSETAKNYCQRLPYDFKCWCVSVYEMYRNVRSTFEYGEISGGYDNYALSLKKIKVCLQNFNVALRIGLLNTKVVSKDDLLNTGVVYRQDVGEGANAWSMLFTAETCKGTCIFRKLLGIAVCDENSNIFCEKFVNNRTLNDCLADCWNAINGAYDAINSYRKNNLPSNLENDLEDNSLLTDIGENENSVINLGNDYDNSIINSDNENDNLEPNNIDMLEFDCLDGEVCNPKKKFVCCA